MTSLGAQERPQLNPRTSALGWKAEISRQPICYLMTRTKPSPGVTNSRPHWTVPPGSLPPGGLGTILEIKGGVQPGNPLLPKSPVNETPFRIYWRPCEYGIQVEFVLSLGLEANDLCELLISEFLVNHKLLDIMSHHRTLSLPTGPTQWGSRVLYHLLRKPPSKVRVDIIGTYPQGLNNFPVSELEA